MSKRQFSFPLLGILVLALGIFGYVNFRKSSDTSIDTTPSKLLAKMKIEIGGATDGLIPLDYTCEGEGVSPELTISGVPKETRSIAIVVDDKDATLGIFTHWMIWDIDPFTRTINQGETPSEATVGKNSYGKFEWGAICPPNGPMHHYRFKIYALNDFLNLPAETTKQADLAKATKGKLVGYGETVASFGK